MSYMGNVELKASNIRRFDVTGSTSATHTLTWTAPNEQSLIVTINGVKQQNNYTVSGTTLTLDTALITTDALEVIGINDVGTTITPAQGSVNTDQLATDAVSTVKIEDDAVTDAKLANSINTDIAANTAKVTNATHTGDVTGATALTIADNAVTLAKLEDGTQGDILYYGASGAPARLGFGTSGHFLKTQGVSANPVWAADNAGAMVFLAKSESSVSTTSIEFQSFQDSAYEFYKIYARIRFTDYGSAIRFRFMDGATPETTSTYTSSRSEFVAASVYGSGGYAQAYMEGPSNADQDSIVMMDITLTFNSSATEHQGSAMSGQATYTRHNDTAANAIFGGIFGADTDFDGLEIYSSDKTFTHHMVYVYGVKNS